MILAEVGGTVQIEMEQESGNLGESWKKGVSACPKPLTSCKPEYQPAFNL
jgi:hypothetical protein